jgi:hypothetical protein
MRIVQALPVFGILAINNCGQAQPSEVAAPLPSAEEAEAVISAEYARFVFPKETAQVYTWAVPESDASSGTPEFGWQVRWDLPWERFGQDPHAVWMIVYWRPGGPHQGPLTALLQEWRPMVMTACMECGTPASRAREDSSVRMRTVENRVVFTVEGADAVKRLFPSPPDTVIFSRMVQRGTEEEDTVGVKH